MPLAEIGFLSFRFAGNAKIQLLETIKRLKIIPEEEFESTIRAYVDYCTPKQNSVCSGRSQTYFIKFKGILDICT